MTDILNKTPPHLAGFTSIFEAILQVTFSCSGVTGT